MKPRQSNLLHCLTVCLAPVLAGLTLQSAGAASATWTGGVGGTATNLSSGANWSSGSATFVSGDVATFDSTTALGLLTLNANIGPSFGATDGLHVLYSGTGNLTIDGIAGTPGLQWGLGNITINSGAGAFSFGDGLESTILVYRGASNTQTYTNNSSNTATFGAEILWRAGGGAAKIVNLDGSGNWQFNAAFRIDATQGQTSVTVVKNGSGTVNLAAANNLASTPSLTINQGAVNVTSAGTLGLLGSFSGAITNNASFSYGSSATQTLSGIISGTGTLTQTAGNLTLTAASTYSGATTVNGGTLSVGGAGSIESSSGITVSGPTAGYQHKSTTPSTRAITLTQGTVGGTGTVGAVTVGNGTGGVVTNGTSAAFTIGSLAFSGAGAISVTDDGDTSTSGIIVSGALSTTPANGTVTVNASNSFWNAGATYNLLSAGSFGGAVSNFTKGTITGLTSRQSASLVLNDTTLALLIGGDSPKWSGLDSSSWVVGTTGANGNWKLINGGTKTDYIQGDVVLFDDSPTNTTVNISAANVSPAVVNFNNSSKNYTINGAFGIAAGTLNKAGTATVTLATANSYGGGTTVNAGTLALTGSGTLGSTSGALAISDGTLNLGGTSQTVGAVSLTSQALVQNGTLTASGLAVSNPFGTATISSSLNLGSGNLSKTGEGTLLLSGPTTSSGTTTISGGNLTIGGSGSLGTSSITLAGGSLDLGGASLVTGAVTVGSAFGLGDVITNGSITPSAFTVTSTTGVATVSANILGTTGITLSGSAGTLSLIGDNTFSGPLNLSNNVKVTIDGGSNTGGGAINYNSFGTTINVNSGSYLTSGITANSESEFRLLNLNGGVLESAGNIFADTLAISIAFDGGTLKCGSPSGITVFEADNWITVKTNGAVLDTTKGNITVGNNTHSIAAVHAHKFRGTDGGTITIQGGKTLLSGVTNNGLVDIHDNSTWDLHGIASSINGISGDGFITSSLPGGALVVTVDAPLTYSGNITGGANLSFQKLGTGTLTLTGNNTYLGDTTVSTGVLAVTGQAIPDAGKLILNGGVVDLTGTEVVASLVFGTVEQAVGTWGATGSGAANIDDVHFTGTGMIQIVPAGYSPWASTNAGGQAANLDFDNDGVSNGIEYFMGQTGSTFTANPSVVTAGANRTVTWPKDPAFNGSYKVQTSPDLTTWTDVTATPAVVDNGTSVVYTLPAPAGKLFVRLVVTPN